MDWDDLRIFLAIARDGSLSAAARRLRLTQPTVGRRLAALQARAGVRLLERTPAGFRLTAAGERILGNVERIEAEALAVERAVTGQDVRLEGAVRLTSIGSFGTMVLTPVLAAVRRQHPGIVIELVVDARTLSLARREADLAVRLAPFDGQEIVARKLADVGYGLYASPDYLARHGQPDLAAGCPGHWLVTVEDNQAGLAEAMWLAGIGRAAGVALRSNARAVQLEAARHGVGLACLPCALADGAAGLVRLAASGAPVRPLWLGVHRDMRSAPRIRAVMDAVVAGFRARAAELAGTR